MSGNSLIRGLSEEALYQQPSGEHDPLCCGFRVQTHRIFTARMICPLVNRFLLLERFHTCPVTIWC